MTEGIETVRWGTDRHVETRSAGQTGKGEFHCSECGYGVTVVRALPACPMCAGTSWERSPWSPFTRSRQLL